MKLEIGKSYHIYIPSEPTPDGCGIFSEEIKLFTIIPKDKQEIIKQHFEHLLEDRWYCVKNINNKRKHWYYLQDNHIITEIK